MNELDPYNGIIEQLNQLVAQGQLSETELIQVIDDVTFMTKNS